MIRVWRYTIMTMAVILLCTAIVLLLAVPIVMIISGVSSENGSLSEIVLGFILIAILYPAFVYMGYTLWKWRRDEIKAIEDEMSDPK